MKFIPLTNSEKCAIVDDEDYELVASKAWSLNAQGYAQAYMGRGRNGERMQLVILPSTEGLHVDHINRDKLDNRRPNLRLCTPSQNQANRGMFKNNKSGYKGVRWDRGKWVAATEVGGVYRHLGRFTSAIDAARAYDKAVVQAHGEFACVNGV